MELNNLKKAYAKILMFGVSEEHKLELKIILARLVMDTIVDTIADISGESEFNIKKMKSYVEEEFSKL